VNLSEVNIRKFIKCRASSRVWPVERSFSK